MKKDKKEVKRPVLIFSQSKARAHTKLGGESDAIMYGRTIETELVPGMRHIAKAFKIKYAQFKDAFVVYDVFSNRHHPKRMEKEGVEGLEKDEALMVTRKDDLDSVLGGW